MAAGVLLGEPALLNALVPGVAYVVAVARTGAVEDPWPARRTGVFLAALLLLAVATSGAADDRARASLAWHMAQQMTLLFVVPLGAIAGRPDLLLGGGVRRAAGARAALGAAWLAAAGIQWIVHLPAMLDAIWDQPATLAVVHWALVVAGLAFFGCALAASSSGRLHPLAAAAYVVSIMAATDAIGLWLLFDPHVAYNRYAGPGALTDQRRAGAVMFASGMVPLLVAARMAYAWISAAHLSDGGGA